MRPVYASSLVTGPSFMSLSSLVLELWQFSFIRDWLEIRKSKIPPSKFCPISGDCGKLGIPNLARISLIKCYWMMQIARGTIFNASELSWEKKSNRGVKLRTRAQPPISPPPLRLGLLGWDSDLAIINEDKFNHNFRGCLNDIITQISGKSSSMNYSQLMEIF